MDRRTSVFMRCVLANWARSTASSTSSRLSGTIELELATVVAWQVGSSFQLAPTSHHLPFFVELWISIRPILSGSLALVVRLLREPRIFLTLLRCSAEIADVAAPVFLR